MTAMEDKTKSQTQLFDAGEPEVVFNAYSDRRMIGVMTSDGSDTLLEITGYALQLKFNRDLLKSVEDIENMLDGMKDLFRKMVMEDLLGKLEEKK